MDTRGAVDLSVAAPKLQMPGRLTAGENEALDRWSTETWDMNAWAWRESQIARLVLASVLEARLLHVRKDRLAAFGLAQHPSAVTLRQLSSLWRSHTGTAGQAFEVAVAAAVEHGMPEVVGPIQEGLRQLGIRDTERPQMILLGLEKVPVEHAAGFYDFLKEWLPDDAVLRTGRPGRPASTATVMQRLAAASWASMDTHAGTADGPSRGGSVEYERARRSQLARADALVYTDTALVPVSLKINRHAVARRGWLDVPLWITGGWYESRVHMLQSAEVPTVVVELGGSSWTDCFKRAMTALDAVMTTLDLHLAPHSRRHVFSLTGREDPLARRMLALADAPIEEIVHELRQVHPGVRDMLEHRIQATPSTANVPLPNAPILVDAWQDDDAAGRIVLGASHLFFGVGPEEEALRRRSWRAKAEASKSASSAPGFDTDPATPRTERPAPRPRQPQPRVDSHLQAAQQARPAPPRPAQQALTGPAPQPAAAIDRRQQAARQARPGPRPS